MKMAEIDWLLNVTARAYSNEEEDPPTKHDNLFYFADICAVRPRPRRAAEPLPCPPPPPPARARARCGRGVTQASGAQGPGGFTEYLYWRRQRACRGFGFTLRGDHDFRLDKFNATSPAVNFLPCYGQDGTGDIYSNDNMVHFAGVVERETGGRMLSFVMGDGGDSVDGEFNRQEWIMRRLAVCQCTTALLVLRKGGNFVLKLFDVFTPLLHDLCFLMQRHFRRTALIKPLTSRPANSERYLVCMGLLQQVNPPSCH
jgi:hypothetical protein